MIPHTQENMISTQILDRFCVAGINYHAAGTDVRGSFSVSREEYARIAEQAKQLNLRSVFVVSTCNRTEIYGFAEHVMLLVNLLTQVTRGSREQFLQFAYLKSGLDALNHLYQVAAGLDSQILGDYEILGQLKQSVDTAASFDMIGPIMNRTVNYAYQASKKIKTTTELSSGTVSVSYAAIELLRELPAADRRNVLVIGTGKFGGNVVRNLREYLPDAQVSLSNRTFETAQLLAERTGTTAVPYEHIASAVTQADVVIVCTNASAHTVVPSFFQGNKKQLVLDLSVPVNVDPAVRNIADVKVIDVDEISATILDKTFARRQAEVPKAEEIILHYKTEFCNWLHEYRYSLHIKSWKDKLYELSEIQPQYCEMAPKAEEQKVQKAVSRLAVNLRTNQEKGCQFINAINDYLQMR
jgi:glutamyl-tRNA reductase